MNLKQPFFKLPVSRDITPAAEEITACINESEWIDHPSSFSGNFYIPLTSYNGTINNLKKTPIKPTIFSDRLPAVTNLLKSFNFTIGISRLMRLKAGSKVPVHADTNEYWDKRVRIHIPLISSEKVFFTCGKEEVVMAPGEAWTFNNWIRHGVRNEGSKDRIHLVFDTKSTNIMNSDGTLCKSLENSTNCNEFTLEKEPIPAIKSTLELTESLSVLVEALQGITDHEKPAATAWLNLIKAHQSKWSTIEEKMEVNISAVSSYQKAIKVAINEADKLGDSLRLKENNVKVRLLFKARVTDAVNLQMLFH